jgi:hypothetical protein
MPTVPMLEVPSVQQESLPGRAFPRVSDDVSAASFGAGIAAGGEAVGAAGSAEEAKQKNDNDRLRVVDANTQLEAAKTAMLYGKDGKGGAASFHGTDAIDMPNRILPQYDQVAGGISASLTQDQQRLFKGHIASGRDALNLQLNRYEFEESNRLANEVYTNGLKQTISDASVGWRDPEQIGKARQDLTALVQMQGDREGWGKDERTQALDKMLAEMHYNVVDRQLADGKPQAALAYFKGVRDTGELTGEQAHQLGAQIDAALQQHTAQNQSALLSQLRDVSTAAMNGMAISPANMPSHGQVLAAFPQDGEKRWKAMQDDITMGADLKGMSTMAPADIQAKVESYKPTSIAGAADQFERYNAVGVAAQRVLTSRAADPRQYTIDNKLGAKPLDLSDMQGLTSELRTRIASTPQTSAQMGGYVPPLSKSEATQFAQRLESMPAADRLRTLASLNQGLADDKGFQTVMHQIMPGSPVTAIVGSQLGQTAPNNVPVWFDRRFAPNPTDQTRILAGEALLNPLGAEKSGEKGKPFPMPSEGAPQSPGLRYAFSSAAGDLFRNRPELGDAYYAAFKGAYAQLAAESGNLSGQLVPDLQTKALKMVLGAKPVDVNGQKVAMPLGMDPTRFQSILDAAVNVKADAAGVPAGYEDKIRGYHLEELGALGSGRYKLTQGNADLVNPDGKGLFIVDLRNQYMAATGAKPAPADAARMAAEQPVAPPTVAEVGGQAGVPKVTSGAEPTFKAPPVTGTARGGRGNGRTHPSQGEVDVE